MSVCSGSNDPIGPSSRYLIEASCIISELLHSRWVARNPSPDLLLAGRSRARFDREDDVGLRVRVGVHVVPSASEQ